MKKISAAILLILCVYIAVDTRFGVFIVFDILGDVFEQSDDLNTDPKSGPLRVTQKLQSLPNIKLAREIEQPSGLHIDDSGIWVSTDQSELFLLSGDGQVISQSQLVGGPLLFRQGRMEAVVVSGDDVFAGGELGAIGHWKVASNHLEKQTDLYEQIDFELTGLCQAREGLWGVLESPALVDLAKSSTHKIDLSAFLRDGRNRDEILVSGLSCDDSHFFVVTENFSSIIVVDKNFIAVAVYALDPIEASDIAVAGGTVLVSEDHNYFDERPPLHRYRLPAH